VPPVLGNGVRRILRIPTGFPAEWAGCRRAREVTVAVIAGAARGSRRPRGDRNRPGRQTISGKKNVPTTTPLNLPALKIGSRVRSTDDGDAGRIVWANTTSVKITWDDGEQVTWRRDSLAGRLIEIIDADDQQGRN